MRLEQYVRRTQQALPPENVPERPLLRYTIARLMFDGISDIDHTMSDWLYYRDDLFGVADQIIERWIDHPQAGILEFKIEPVCSARGCQCQMMKTQIEELKNAAKEKAIQEAAALNALAGDSGSGSGIHAAGNGSESGPAPAPYRVRDLREHVRPRPRTRKPRNSRAKVPGMPVARTGERTAYADRAIGAGSDECSTKITK